MTSSDCERLGRVSVATALAKVADDVELIDTLLAADRLDEWTIERTIKTRDVELARAEREAELTATGIRVLTAEEATDARRLDSVLTDKVDRQRHRKEPCHAAAVATGWDGVNVVGYCTELRPTPLVGTRRRSIRDRPDRPDPPGLAR